MIDNKQFDAYSSIPAEKFTLVKSNVNHDVKFDTKPVGYFRDALNRFAKNKASVVAAAIIILIVLFAVLAPLFNFRYDGSFSDGYYRSLGPRNLTLAKIGIANAGVERKVNPYGYIKMQALGMGAEDPLGEGVTLAQGLASKYNPILSEKSTYKQGSTTYTVLEIESYYEKGFYYFQLTDEEYNAILEWEKQSGLKVIYPMVDFDNEYCATSDDANCWYKTSGKVDRMLDADGNVVPYANGGGRKLNTFAPLSTKGGKVAVIKDVATQGLEDNYLRDADGNVQYYVNKGSSAEKYVRVLYYNYYIYKNGFEPEYIFGTDLSGYDMALRLAGGIKLSLLVAICVSAINLFIGTIYGAVEGYYGGAVDMVLERVSDILSGVPFIVIATLFQMHFARKVGSVPSLLLAFVITGWIGTASRVRTQFYRFKNQEYVLAARTLGAGDGRIMFKHIFPNALGTIITSSVLVIPSVIFSESMLSYLGIVSWQGAGGTSLGTLLSDASTKWTYYPHLMIFPAVVIALLMISFNLFGNGLRDAFNPSLRGSEE